MLLSNQNSPSSTCYTVAAENVTILCNGHSITGGNTADTYGIYSNQYGTTVKNCDISQFYAAIYFYYMQKGTIESNNLHNNLNYGTRVVGSPNNRIINNTASYDGNHGFYSWASQNTLIANNTAFGNSGTCGIYAEWYSHNTTMVNNTAYSNIRGICLVNGANNNIVDDSNVINNTVYSNSNQGIYIQYSNKNTLIGNRLSSNGNYDIYLQPSSINNTFYWNNFSGTASYYVYDANGVGSNYYNATTPAGSNNNNYTNSNMWTITLKS
jgi:parallel beta-helix repeat protein